MIFKTFLIFSSHKEPGVEAVVGGGGLGGDGGQTVAPVSVQARPHCTPQPPTSKSNLSWSTTSLRPSWRSTQRKISVKPQPENSSALSGAALCEISK